VELHVDDDGFVRAPAPLVYRRLTHVASWPSWWRGVTTAPLPPAADAPGDERWLLELRGAPLRRLRLAARLHGWRHEHGFALALSGDVDGHAEFWLEPGWGGTVVHHLLVARTAHPKPLQVHRDYRRSLRRGLWGLKDLLHLEARTTAGLAP
jgi:hypothetical protein